MKQKRNERKDDFNVDYLLLIDLYIVFFETMRDFFRREAKEEIIRLSKKIQMSAWKGEDKIIEEIIRHGARVSQGKR